MVASGFSCCCCPTTNSRFPIFLTNTPVFLHFLFFPPPRPQPQKECEEERKKKKKTQQNKDLYGMKPGATGLDTVLLRPAGSGRGGQGFPIHHHHHHRVIITRPSWSKRSWRSCPRTSRLSRQCSRSRTRRARVCRNRSRLRTSTLGRTGCRRRGSRRRAPRKPR